MAIILSRSNVDDLLEMPEVVDWMGEAFIALSTGTAIVPVRGFFQLPDSDDGLLIMPAWQPGTDRSPSQYAVKLVSMVHTNPSKGLPLTSATVLVINADSGKLIAVVEGEQLTAVRTGGGSGLATRFMARKDASVAAVIGAGRQAETQLEAVCAVRDIEHAFVVSRTESRGTLFARTASESLGIPVKWVDRMGPESSEILRTAHVICTATDSSVPVLFDRDVSPGTHINGVGSHRPTMAEVHGDVVKRATVVVDQREACLIEAGDIVQPIEAGELSAESIAGEIGDVVVGNVSGRSSDEEVTFFKSVGNGVQDLVVACKLVEKAKRAGLGTTVDMS